SRSGRDAEAQEAVGAHALPAPPRSAARAAGCGAGWALVLSGSAVVIAFGVYPECPAAKLGSNSTFGVRRRFVGSARSSASAAVPASRFAPAAIGQRRFGACWRRNPPPAGPTIQPICHDWLENAR